MQQGGYEMRSPDDKLMTIAEVCERLSIARDTLSEATKAGKIARVKIGRAVRYWMSEVDRHGANPTDLTPVEAATPAPETALTPTFALAPDDPTYYDRRLAELIVEMKVRPDDGARMHRLMNMVHEEMADREKLPRRVAE